MESQPQVHAEVEQLQPDSTPAVQPASLHAPEITEVVETPTVVDLRTELIETMDLLSLQEKILKERVRELLRSKDIATILTQIAQLDIDPAQEMTTAVKEASWLEDQRGILMGVAAGIATSMIGLIASPPGGVWELITNNNDRFCTASHPCIPGTAISSYVQPTLFQEFVKYVTICFVFAISIIFLLLCGFHFHKGVLAWIYTVFMCLTLCFWSITYYKVLQLVDSSSAIPYSSVDIRSYYGGVLTLVWIPLIGLIAFLVALGKMVYKKTRTPAALPCV